jgi:transglutaminase-like putative cysteine protease
MHVPRLVAACTLALATASSAPAQFQSDAAKGPRLENTVVQQWRIGIVVTAGSSPVRGVLATTSVPADWPEQEVRIVKEDVSPGARVSYRMIDGAVKEMALRVPSLQANGQAQGIVTLEIRRSWQVAPEHTGIYAIPDPRRLDRKMRAFLMPSPYIDSNDAQIKALAQRIGAGEDTAWARVEAVYDWVYESITYVDDRELAVKDTSATLRDRTGDCDEKSSVFIAICRAAGIPARTVRVPGHCYPEFYLEDDEGKGHWFPCQAAGTRAFGEMPEHRPILQKGDNLLIAEPGGRRKTRCRFLPDSLVIADRRPGASPPRLEIVFQPVSN